MSVDLRQEISRLHDLLGLHEEQIEELTRERNRFKDETTRLRMQQASDRAEIDSLNMSLADMKRALTLAKMTTNNERREAHEGPAPAIVRSPERSASEQSADSEVTDGYYRLSVHQSNKKQSDKQQSIEIGVDHTRVVDLTLDSEPEDQPPEPRIAQNVRIPLTPTSVTSARSAIGIKRNV